MFITSFSLSSESFERPFTRSKRASSSSYSLKTSRKFPKIFERFLTSASSNYFASVAIFPATQM